MLNAPLARVFRHAHAFEVTHPQSVQRSRVSEVGGLAEPFHPLARVFRGVQWSAIGVGRDRGTAVVLLVNGFGEETGWRGFLLPAFQARFSPLVAMGPGTRPNVLALR